MHIGHIYRTFHLNDSDGSEYSYISHFRKFPCRSQFFFQLSFLGMFVAMIINRKTTHFKGFWRACFSMSIAVPQFVSLLVMHTMLQPQGAVNRMLQTWGWIDGPLPFFTNATWARVTVIIINLWVGIPYTIMQITGILQNIPADQYEAAKIDGANWWQIFTKITMPYIIFVLTPYLITSLHRQCEQLQRHLPAVRRRSYAIGRFRQAPPICLSPGCTS